MSSEKPEITVLTPPLLHLPDQSEAVLLSMQKSRRLVFVLSPNFLAEKSFSLLECRLGLYLQHSLQASIITVVYRSVSKLPCVEVAQLRHAANTSITWRGSQSEAPRSRFWLRLRLALPVRPLALGRRLIDSTSSHSDLAALALQRVHRIQIHNHGSEANHSHRNRRASANQSRRDRQAMPRGRGRMKRSTCREDGSQHSRRCSGCTVLAGQVEDRGVPPTVEAEMQQMSHGCTAIQSDPVPETQPHPPSDSTVDPVPTPDPGLDFTASTCPQNDDIIKCTEQQQVIGLKTSEEV
ncbi:uncharacterized protein LOC121517203 [Cheilinus undulatus]|uniref:uncharacterized protein LOC121517203 n=1 Tax=Cheilinus undulatus TaxID=241271 RepID=UPI001BD2BE2A|nr:uncharacterized protein LOC121517203 [Cheilinus undulatus]